MHPLGGRGTEEEKTEEKGWANLVKQHFRVYLKECILVISGRLYHYHSRGTMFPIKE